MSDAARLGSGASHPSFDDVPVGSVLAAALASMTAEASHRRVALTSSIDVDTVWCDADLLRRVLERLLEHAVRFAPGGGGVDVSLHRGIFTLRLITGEQPDDTGPALASVGRTLGVCFAETVMHAQGGAVWLEADGDGSPVFRIAMPPKPRPG
jgi:K+-sensing histidine kinase KdpD